MRNSKIHIFLLFLFFVNFSCDNGDNFDFPYVYMNVSINVFTDAEYYSLQNPTGSLIIDRHPNGETTIGYDNNGIIIYNSGLANDPFYAFDRTCPHDLPKSIALDLNGSIATCPECGSQYILSSEGLPSTGSVSRYYLKKYRTTYYSNGTLLIYN